MLCASVFLSSKNGGETARKETLLQLGIQLHNCFSLERPYFSIHNKFFTYASHFATQNIKIDTQGSTFTKFNYS